MKKKHVMNLFVIQQRKRKTKIIHEQETVDSIYFIKSGSIELSMNKTLKEMDDILKTYGYSFDTVNDVFDSVPKFKTHYLSTKIH